MSLSLFGKIAFDVALVALWLALALNREKLIAFEKKLSKRLTEDFRKARQRLIEGFRKTRLCKEINRMIRAYEMAHQEVQK